MPPGPGRMGTFGGRGECGVIGAIGRMVGLVASRSVESNSGHEAILGRVEWGGGGAGVREKGGGGETHLTESRATGSSNAGACGGDVEGREGEAKGEDGRGKPAGVVG